MNLLPIEIETEIWKLYYMDIYKNSCLKELNNNFNLINSIDNYILDIKKILRIHRFFSESEIASIINSRDLSIKEHCEKLNKAIIFLKKNSIYKKITNSYAIIYILNKNPINNILINFIPSKFQDIAHCISYSCNYQKKMLKKFKELII